MITKIVSEITPDVEMGLKHLTNGICPWPMCKYAGNTVIAVLKNKKERPCFENSLLLCQEHAAQCVNSTTDYSEFLQDIRRVIRGNRGMLVKESRLLCTREEYIKTVVDEVPKSKNIKCIYVGPLVLHPDWYFDLRENQTNIKSMDRIVSEAVKNKNIKVTIIMRNEQRYIEKVKECVLQSKMSSLIAEIKKNFDEYIFSEAYNNTVLFWDAGIYHIPIILDHACIFAIRDDAISPITHGTISENKEEIYKENRMFDSLVSNRMQLKATKAELDNLLSRLI